MMTKNLDLRPSPKAMRRLGLVTLISTALVCPPCAAAAVALELEVDHKLQGQVWVEQIAGEWHIRQADIAPLIPPLSAPSAARAKWLPLNALPNTSWQFSADNKRLVLETRPRHITATAEQSTAIAMPSALIDASSELIDTSSAQVTGAETQMASAETQEQSLYLDLVINESARNVIIEVRRTAGRWQVQRSELTALGLIWPMRDSEWIALDDLPDTRWEYHAPTQRLLIHTQPKYLPVQQLGQQPLARPTAERDWGGLINYSAAYHHSNRAPSQSSLWHELKAFSPQLLLETTGIYRPDALDDLLAGYRRFDTQLSYESETTRSLITLGDVINSGSESLPSYRVGGLRIARDFGLDPDRITYPTPLHLGEAELPSTLDIWINDHRVQGASIDAGPYQVPFDSLRTGYNTATLVRTDLQGRPTTETLNFYVATHLLQTGLVDYDFTHGRIRQNYGLKSDAYSDQTLTSGRLAYGLNARVTLDGQAQHTLHKTNWGGGLRASLGRFGTLSGQLMQSRTADASDGAQSQQLSYDFTYYGLSLHASHLRRDANFAEMIDYGASYALRRQTLLGASRSLGSWGQLSLSYNERRYWDHRRTAYTPEGVPVIDGRDPYLTDPALSDPYLLDPYALTPYLTWQRHRDLKFVQAAWLKPLGNKGMVSARWQRNSQFNEDAFSLGLTYYFDRTYVGSLNHARQAYGEVNQVSLSRRDDYPYGIGWGLSAADSPGHPVYADVSLRHPLGQGAVRTAQYAGTTNSLADWNGSLIFLGGDWFMSGPVYDAFALVDTGHAEVPVLTGSHLQGDSSRTGRRLIPDIASYLTHTVQIDPLALPENMRIEETRKQFRAKRGGGVTINFGVEQVTQVIAQVTDAAHTPLPSGATLTRASGDPVWVGWQGAIFIQDAQSAERLEWTDGKCQVILPSLALGQSHYLEPLVCTDKAPATPPTN